MIAQEKNLPSPFGHYAMKHWPCSEKAERPLIICFHGWLDNANSFINLAEQLQANYELLAFDFPGHGLSFHRSGHYLMTDYLADIQFIVQHYSKTREIILLGHSMGAGLISILGALAPIAKHIILLDFIGALTLPTEQIASSLKKHVASISQLGKQDKKSLDFAKAIATKSRMNQIPAHIAENILSRNVTSDGENTYWVSDPKTRQPSPWYLTEEQILSLLSQNKHNGLLLVSHETEQLYSKHIHQRAQQMPNLKVTTMPGNHFFHTTHARETAACILNYLESNAQL